MHIPRVRSPLVPTLLTLSTTAIAALAPAQQVRVDYPDSTIVAPPELRFPLYTLHGGGTVRLQVLCPAAFTGLPAQPMLVTKFGMQIAGREAYSRFEVRCGTSPRTDLSYSWTDNLPDQRLQQDLGNTVLQGGLQNGAPVNQWVEYDLDHPFLWQPGQSITLDVIAASKLPDSFCLTAGAATERLYDAPYRDAATGLVLAPTGGIKFRIVFEPVGFLSFGAACAGTGGAKPAIHATGSSQLGNLALVHLTNALGGAPTAMFLGSSRARAPFGPLPLPFGGGCALLTSMELAWPVTTSGSGPGNGNATVPLPIPGDPSLRGFVAFVQWVQLDRASPAVIPFTTTGAIAMVLL